MKKKKQKKIYPINLHGKKNFLFDIYIIKKFIYNQ